MYVFYLLLRILWLPGRLLKVGPRQADPLGVKLAAYGQGLATGVLAAALACCGVGLSKLYAQEGSGAKSFALLGRVVDSQAAPLRAARVEIHETGQTTLTDHQGRFAFEQAPRGEFHLHVQRIGYQAWAKTLRPPLPDCLLVVLTSTDLELDAVLVEADPLKQAAKASPLAVETLSRSELLAAGGDALAQNLASLPGVSRISLGTGIGKPVIRGMSFNRVAVLEGGVRQQGQQWGADHGLELDPLQVERLEVVRGPATLQYGSDALGGVVRVRPGPDPAQGTREASAYLGYRSVNHNALAALRLAGHERGWVYHLQGSVQDFADFRVPAERFFYNQYVLALPNGELKNTAGRTLAFQAGLGVRRTRGKVDVRVSHYHQQAGLFSGAVGVPRAFQLTPDGDPRNWDFPYFDTRHLKVLINSQILLGGNWLDLDVGYQRNHRQERSLPHAHGFVVEDSSTLALELVLHSADLSLRHHHRLLPKLKGAAGLAATLQWNRQAGFEFLLPDFFRSEAGLYYLLTWEPTPRTTLTTGLRTDWSRVDIAAHSDRLVLTNSQDTVLQLRNPEVKRDFPGVSAALGVSHQAHPNWLVKANLSTDYRYPQPNELALNGYHHGTFRFEQGQADLPAERGYQLDLGATWSLNSLRVRLTPFAAWFSNYLYLAPTPTFSDRPAGGQIYRYQATRALFVGGELSADWRPLPAWRLQGFLDGVLTYNAESRLPLPLTPPPRARLQTTYSLALGPRNSLLLEAGLQYLFEQNRVDRNERSTPASLRLNTGLVWRLQWGGKAQQLLEIALRVQNLLDARVFHHLSRYRMLNLPEPGRNVQLSLRLPLQWSAGSEQGARQHQSP